MRIPRSFGSDSPLQLSTPRLPSHATRPAPRFLHSRRLGHCLRQHGWHHPRHDGPYRCHCGLSAARLSRDQSGHDDDDDGGGNNDGGHVNGSNSHGLDQDEGIFDTDGPDQSEGEAADEDGDEDEEIYIYFYDDGYGHTSDSHGLDAAAALHHYHIDDHIDTAPTSTRGIESPSPSPSTNEGGTGVLFHRLVQPTPPGVLGASGGPSPPASAWPVEIFDTDLGSSLAVMALVILLSFLLSLLIVCALPRRSGIASFDAADEYSDANVSKDDESESEGEKNDDVDSTVAVGGYVRRVTNGLHRRVEQGRGWRAEGAWDRHDSVE